MEYFGVTPPKVHVPYIFIYAIAFLMELLYHFFGLEPLMTRFEVNLVALTNTFSIENARRDLGYAPTNNHSWDATIQFYKESEKGKVQEETKRVTRAPERCSSHVNLVLLKMFMLAILAVFSGIFVPYIIL